MRSETRRRMSRPRLLFETLEPRQLLAADIEFADPEAYTAGHGPWKVAAGDVNQDGILDLIVGTANGEKHVSVLLGEGDGVFAPERTFPAGTSSIGDVADFDGDGNLDLCAVGAAEGFYVLLNQGSTDGRWNGFSRPSSRVPLDDHARSVISADLNDDGNADVVIGASDRVTVLLNEGTTDGQWGGFAGPDSYDAGSYPWSVAVGHLNGDTVLDIAVGNGFSDELSVLLGTGDGTFDLLANYPVGAGNGVGSVALEDFDGDGDLDAALKVRKSHTVGVLRGNGDGTFSEPAYYSVSHGVGHIITGDWDRDGDIDIATQGEGVPEIDLLLNQGDATFVRHPDSLYPMTGSVGLMMGADLDGDADTDIVFAGAGGYFQREINVFLNLTPPPPLHLPGDSNLDGAFNRLDLVQVLQAGKYGTGEPATWGEGDWNGDGVFDQWDIVAALRADGDMAS